MTTVRGLLAPDAHLVAGINSIDLSMVKTKLEDSDEGVGWSSEYCDRVEVEYRRYLALSRAYPQKAVVPSRIVDTFWHAHILDTQAYGRDCERTFGFFLHHYPYFGMRGREDAQALGDAYDETLNFYAFHFGPAPEDIWARSGAARCPNCGNRCK